MQAFAKNYLAIGFKLDYVRADGDLSNYIPDFIVRDSQGRIWIIETKGRVWEDTAVKDTAMRDWCARISQQTGQRWEYARVNQADFEAHKPRTLADATQMSGQESSSMTL